MPFKFTRLDIPEVILVEPAVFGDDRGFFLESYKRSDFVAGGIAEDFVQANHSKSSGGVLRGLHYQHPPNAQGKLVRCVRGAIFDVAVDIRKGSPTFGRWVAEELSEENKLLLYVPAGFAHAFYVTSESAEVIYHCTEEYSAGHDAGIIYNDPEIAIDWPQGEKQLSGKDAGLPMLKDADIRFTYEGHTI